MRDLIIVVDTQADFMLPDGALPVPGADHIVGPIANWLATRLADNTAAVVFTLDTHFADTYPDTEEALMFPIHCVKDTPGWRNLIDPLTIDPAIPCYALEKGVFDMRAEQDIVLADPRGMAPAAERDAHFKALREAGVRTAIVVGVAADFCVRWAVDGLVARGFTVHVPADLTRGITRSIEQVVADDFADGTVTTHTAHREAACSATW